MPEFKLIHVSKGGPWELVPGKDELKFTYEFGVESLIH